MQYDLCRFRISEVFNVVDNPPFLSEIWFHWSDLLIHKYSATSCLKEYLELETNT
jgi:hypothetical protein